jgi:hypothetical protein
LEAAPSTIVPVCTIDGVWPVGMPSARTSERRFGSGKWPRPELFTPMLCAVQRLPFRKVAAEQSVVERVQRLVLPVWARPRGRRSTAR